MRFVEKKILNLKNEIIDKTKTNCHLQNVSTLKSVDANKESLKRRK